MTVIIIFSENHKKKNYNFCFFVQLAMILHPE